MMYEFEKKYETSIKQVNEFYVSKKFQIKEEFEGLKSLLSERMISVISMNQN